MTKRIMFVFALAFFGVPFSSPVLAGSGWVCMKDGKKIKIKGKNPEKKQKKCEAKGGTWEEKKAEAASTEKAPAAEMGTGTGW